MGGILFLSLMTGLIIYIAWFFYPYINAKIQLYLLRHPSTVIVSLDESAEESAEIEPSKNTPNKVLIILQKYFVFYSQKISDFVQGI
jgi:hypothetical protein